MRHVSQALKRNFLVLSLAVLLALGVVYLLSTQLQKLISGPILSLAHTATRVTEKKDYSIRAVGVISVGQDITERKKAEKEMRQLRNYLHNIVNSMPSMLVGVDAEGVMAIMKMKVDSLLATDSSSPIDDFLRDTQEVLIDLIAQTQQITKDLGCPLLHELGFKAAVEEWLHSDIEKKYDLVTTVHDQDCPRVKEDTAAMLFRAIRELSMNVVKHAQARHISITLSRWQDQVRVVVADDGVGFDPTVQTNDATNGGYGLFSIKERVDYLDGLFEIHSEPGKGTEVIMSVPLTPAYVRPDQN